MTKEELIELSEETFTSNNAKQITAEGQRLFNERLVETMVTGAKQGDQELPLEGGVIQIPEFPAFPEFPVNEFTSCEFENFTFSSSMYWKIDYNSIVLNGSCEYLGERGILSIINIPSEYLKRVKRSFSVVAGIGIDNDVSHKLVEIKKTEEKLEIIPVYTGINSTGFINLTYAQIILDAEEPEIICHIDYLNWSETITGIVYGNGMFIVISGSSSYYKIIDGIIGNIEHNNLGGGGIGITFGDGKFLVISYQGGYTISTNGTTWTSGKTGAASLDAVAYGNGLFVAIGNGGRCAVSSNGTTWTPGNATSLKCITYGNGLFVAGGSAGSIAISNYGTTWTTYNTGLINAINDIAYGNGMFVAIASGEYAVSINGKEWTIGSIGLNNMHAIAYGNGKFLCVGDSGNYAISTDGVTWSTGSVEDIETLYSLDHITYGNGKFVATCSPSRVITFKI